MPRIIMLTLSLLFAFLVTNVISAQNITSYFESERLTQILNKVHALQTGKVGAIVDQFDTSKNWNWILEEGSLPENTNALTQLSTKGAYTIIDMEKLKYATELSLARTIIHEMVHAHLLLSFIYNNVNASLEYPGIVREWAATPTPDYNTIQHQEMAESFVNDIALALKKYNYYENRFSDNSVYIDLAWGGLDFENSVSLNDYDRKRIQITLTKAQLNVYEKAGIITAFQ